MDKRLIRAMLAVMNADSGKPEGHEWFAEETSVSPWSAEKGLAGRLQFWLLSDVYVIEQAEYVEGLISQ